MNPLDETTQAAVKDWINRAAKARNRAQGKPLSTQEARNQIVRDYYGLPGYLDLVKTMQRGTMPKRIITEKSGGIYECKTDTGITLSYQDILNVVGPHCVSQEIQFKLIDQLDKMGDLRFVHESNSSLRARTAAWRVGRNLFDQMFVLLFDREAGTQVPHNSRPAGKLMFEIEDAKVIDMYISHI